MVGLEDWSFPIEYTAIDGDTVVIKWWQQLPGHPARRHALPAVGLLDARLRGRRQVLLRGGPAQHDPRARGPGRQRLAPEPRVPLPAGPARPQLRPTLIAGLTDGLISRAAEGAAHVVHPGLLLAALGDAPAVGGAHEAVEVPEAAEEHAGLALVAVGAGHGHRVEAHRASGGGVAVDVEHRVRHQVLERREARHDRGQVGLGLGHRARSSRRRRSSR